MQVTIGRRLFVQSDVSKAVRGRLFAISQRRRPTLGSDQAPAAKEARQERDKNVARSTSAWEQFYVNQNSPEK